MKFLHHLFSNNKPSGFDKIDGYDDIKKMRALDSEDNYNLLFTGPPCKCKDTFPMRHPWHEKGWNYQSNTTNRFLNVLEEERPKIICIDELHKMSRTFQNQLLNFMESGRIKVDQQKKQYDLEINGAKIFATCNGYPGLCSHALDVST